MIGWQNRVVEERRELSERLVKLGEFICGIGYRGLGSANQWLLDGQYYHRTEYLKILDVLIKLFGGK